MPLTIWSTPISTVKYRVQKQRICSVFWHCDCTLTLFVETFSHVRNVNTNSYFRDVAQCNISLEMRIGRFNEKCVSHKTRSWVSTHHCLQWKHPFGKKNINRSQVKRHVVSQCTKSEMQNGSILAHTYTSHMHLLIHYERKRRENNKKSYFRIPERAVLPGCRNVGDIVRHCVCLSHCMLHICSCFLQFRNYFSLSVFGSQVMVV